MTKSRIDKHLPVQRAAFLICLGLIMLSILGAQTSPVAKVLSRGERVPLLMFGIDAADASQHTDTLMVGVLDSVQNTLNVLSIPRDTRPDLPGYRFNRINEVYGYQFRKTKDRREAAAMVRTAVEHLLSGGQGGVSIPYFVQLDFSGFRKMVDILGGIWVTIKQPMHYDDNAGGYHFHRDPGRYLMDGQEALFYVRFRGHTGDRGRIYRQQEFVRNMIKRLANPIMVFRVPEMIMAFRSSVFTNLSFWDALYLTMAGRRLRGDSVGFYILPGTPRGPYWAPRKDMAQPLASMLLNGDSTLVESIPTIAPQQDRITVNVWNASGKKGFGYQITKELRERGYDVMDWGNYAAEQLQTRVIDRRGKLSNARAVAADLGVDSFHSEPNPKALVDVEVVIGQNYQGLGEVKDGN